MNRLGNMAGTIDVARLSPGVNVLIDADDVYEFTVQRPDIGLIEIVSTHPALQFPIVGQLLGMLIQPRKTLVIRFHNGKFVTAPIRSARVSGVRSDGSRWAYDVFNL